jgi:hypothetical protein
MGAGSSVVKTKEVFNAPKNEINGETPESSSIEHSLIQTSDSAHNVVKIDVYVGDRNIFGYKHGFGSLDYSNGDIYSGSWLNNKKDGRGSDLKIVINSRFIVCMFQESTYFSMEIHTWENFIEVQTKLLFGHFLK